ncbi:MAG: glutamine synthetase beta-grasp domain-containing protein, partial [Solirubrobacterales bacterium]
MPETPTTAKEALAFCEDNDVRFVRLWFTDILGQLTSFSINVADLEDAFEGGMGFDGSS